MIFFSHHRELSGTFARLSLEVENTKQTLEKEIVDLEVETKRLEGLITKAKLMRSVPHIYIHVEQSFMTKILWNSPTYLDSCWTCRPTYSKFCGTVPHIYNLEGLSLMFKSMYINPKQSCSTQRAIQTGWIDILSKSIFISKFRKWEVYTYLRKKYNMHKK